MNNSFIFKIIIFTVMINISTGLVYNGITDINDTKVFSKIGDKNGSLILPSYNQTYSYTFASSFDNSISPPGSSYSTSWRILDMINLGFFIKFMNTFSSNFVHGFYGLPNVLDAMFGVQLQTHNNELYQLLFAPVFGLFYLIMTIIYGIGFFMLITGRFFQN